MSSQPGPEDQPPWGEVSFRRRQAERGGNDDAWSRFWIGVIILVAGALIYPVYSYRVVTYLMSRDLEEGMKPIVEEMNESARQLRNEVAQQAVVSEAQRARNEAAYKARRIRSVQIKGISITSGQPTVVVDFGFATDSEIVGPVCEQAPAWFRRDIRGQIVRVQRYRGSQPALDAGTLTCP